MRVRALTTLATVVLAVAGCSSDTGTTASSPATPPTTNPAADGVQLGDAITITRTDTGAPVGTIRFAEVVVVPDGCVIGTRPGTMIAIRVEIDNGPGEQLPVPDTYALRATSRDGYTAAVETASVHTRCEPTYPEAVTAPVGDRTEGWVTVRSRGVPTELVYSPYVGAQSSTAEDITMLDVSPAKTQIQVPPLDASAAPDTTTAEPPTPPTVTKPSDKPVPPPTGLDSEGRPTGSGGELVECAGEDYQPGTGIFADGSMGYAPECLADR